MAVLRRFETEFDVIVVGAGHAGTEAAVAAARLGARVGLITSALETIGQMSCNPAIGGSAQGTFLRGRIHIGTDTHMSGGRAGESATTHLAEQLENAGLAVARFKTGTPPRIDGRSVDFSQLEIQESEIDQFDYSWSHFWPEKRRGTDRARHPAQLPCWITFLEAQGKQIITDNISRSAMYGGAISSRGPRYCPSVEDKIVKFPAAEKHQLFLEPEGHDTSELYVNGLSTSLPAEVQLEILRSVRGLSNVRMNRAGYAIEYDYYPPTQLDSSLQVKVLPGLYFAGQINGTTGYEEAAGQGLVAGLNAALRAQDRVPVVLGRETSYIGGLVDDLVTRGVYAPYRLFTSRSEFRLTVRQDNALRRLGQIGIKLGVYTIEAPGIIANRLENEDEAIRLAESTSIRPEQAAAILDVAGSAHLAHALRIAEVAKRQEGLLRDLFAAAGVGNEVSSHAGVTAGPQIKYAGYFERERVQADRMRRMGDFVLDSDLEYQEMKSLSFEARQKLSRIRPQSLAQASRIPGVSPSDLQNLVIEIERRRRLATTR